MARREVDQPDAGARIEFFALKALRTRAVVQDLSRRILGLAAVHQPRGVFGPQPAFEAVVYAPGFAHA